jgi:hypothetical protein
MRVSDRRQTGEISTHSAQSATSFQRRPDEWPKLIHKLRGIGLDEEAHHLELAVGSLPRERKTESSGPFDQLM